MKTLVILILLLAAALSAQTGGTYDLSHSVIAGGGGSQSVGGQFTLDGTAGQNLAGTESSNGPYQIRGGFWSFDELAPTAALVSVSGSIRTFDGASIRNIVITLTNLSTGEARSARSTSFGHYRFDGVQAGEAYLITVTSRRYTFESNTRILTVLGDLTDVDFAASAQ